MVTRSMVRAAGLIVLLGAVCLLCFGCGQGEKQGQPLVTVQAAPARKTDISRVVSAEAVIFPIEQSAITPKINAPVKKFYVARGQKVRKGQLLAVLENRDLSGVAMDNTGAFEQAQAAYTTSVNATVPEETQKAELDVQTAKEQLDAQQKLYASRGDLFKQGALPRKDLDAAAVALAQAKSAYNIARKHLDALNATGRQQELKSASGQLTSAKGRLMASQAQLSYSEIRSPIDGYVTDRPLYPGEMASTSMPLLTVMDISRVLAKAHIPQSDAQLLQKGDKAGISVAGLEKKFEGTVVLISPALDPNSTTVEIWVQAANQEQQLRPGATVELSITAQTVHDALVVPASALLNASGDQAQVMVVDGQNVAQSRNVKTGIATPQEAQIISGLKAGEIVVSEGAYGLPDNTRVQIAKANAASAEKEKAAPAEKDDKD